MDIKKEFTAGKSLDEIKKDFFEEKEKNYTTLTKKNFQGIKRKNKSTEKISS